MARSGSIAVTASSRLQSITSASPTVWPHWLVPAPRGSIGTWSSAAISTAA